MISEFISWRFYDRIHMESESGRWEDTRLLFFKHSTSVHGAHITNMMLESCLPYGQEFLVNRVEWRYIPNDCKMTSAEITEAALTIAKMGVLSLDIMTKRYFTDTLNEVFYHTYHISPAVLLKGQENFGVMFEWQGGKTPAFPEVFELTCAGT